MLKLYPNDVKLVQKDFPLRNHAFSEPAAIAALAAGRQGKYWEMHDVIFANYNQLSTEKFDELAKQIGLDMEKFKIDKEDVQLKKQVQLAIQNGYAAGVRGTPSLFVNGRLLKNRNLDGFREMIDKELKRIKGGA